MIVTPLKATPIIILEDDNCFLVTLDPIPHNYPILYDYFKLRHEIFIQRLNWTSLVCTDGVEIDQYDSDSAEYILLLSKFDQRILAGIRVCKTNQEHFISPCSMYPTSYMIRDAYLDRLEEIPKSVCYDEPPVGKDSVELTRLISTSPEYLKKIIVEGSKYLAECGINECLILANPSFMRLGQIYGFDPRAIGPVQGKKDEKKFIAISYDPKVREINKKNV